MTLLHINFTGLVNERAPKLARHKVNALLRLLWKEFEIKKVRITFKNLNYWKLNLAKWRAWRTTTVFKYQLTERH